MKKFLLMVVVMMAALGASAQEMYIGGGISLWRDTDRDQMAFSISPDFGYELNERWAVGGELIYAHNSSVDGNFVKNGFAIAPYGRFTYYQNKVVRLFLDMGVGFSTYKKNGEDSEVGFEVGVKPGLAIKCNEHFSFVTKVGFVGFRDAYLASEKSGFGIDFNGNNISIGIEYAF